MTTLATRRRFTVDEYHRMGRAGVFGPADRVELLEGEIIQMSPIGKAHASAVARAGQLFYRLAGSRAIVWTQNPIRIDRHGEPQPDVALLRPREDFYAGGHPEPADILLIIEVADTSQDYDRDQKLPAYARAGIQETWLALLGDGALEVHRDPGPDGYRSVKRFARGETIRPLAVSDTLFSGGAPLEIKRVEPLALPDCAVRVEDLLGPA